MKVCFISPIKIFPVTGNSFRTINFARALRNRGHNIYIICLRRDVDKREEFSYKNMKLYNVNNYAAKLLSFLPLLKRFLYIIKYLSRITTLYNKNNFDIFHCVTIMIPIGLWIKFILRKRLIVDLHACATLEEKWRLKKPIVKIKEKFMCRVSDIIIVPTEELRENYHSWGINKNKIKVVKNAIDLNSFKPKKSKEEMRRQLGFNKNDFIVFFHGDLENDYNIDALKRLKEINLSLARKFSNVKILIAGYFRKKPVENPHFIYTGYVKNLADYIRASDIAVVPIFQNSLGMRTRILEYFAASLPVITTSAGITGMEFVSTSGAVIVKNSVVEITLSLERIINNKNELDDMRKMIPEITKKFSINEAGKKLEKIYYKDN